MLSAASLREYTYKDLAQMAKKRGVSGWHSMRKDELVRSLVRAAKSAATSKGGGSSRSPAARTKGATSKRATAARAAASSKKTSQRATTAKSRSTTAGKSGSSAAKERASGRNGGSAKSSTSTAAQKRIQKVQDERQRLKDLSMDEGGHPVKDRAILMVRDSYWLQAYWELSRKCIERAQAAMAEHWHSARPMLRLLEVDTGATTSTTEKVVRDIPIHGGVRNWYIDVVDPPKSYRIEIGYQAADGPFFTLLRSNRVTTPPTTSADAVDENWRDIADNCEKIFALSGGRMHEGAPSDLADMFEEQLRRPMGSPMESHYGAGAERVLNRPRDFEFEVDAEMIVYGSARPGAYVTLAGDPIKLREDGTFLVKVGLPEKRQVLPICASSADGVEQRTIVLAIERNTKTMEPVIREAGQ